VLVIRGRSFAIGAVALGLVAPASAHATTLNFDSSPPADNAVVTTQYAATAPEGGPTFAAHNLGGHVFHLPTVITAAAGVAHSGTRVLRLDGPDNETPIPDLDMTFGSGSTATRSSVSLWVRNDESPATAVTFTLSAHSASQTTPIASQTLTVPASGAWTQFTVTAAAPVISEVTLVAANNAEGFFDVDDLTYDDPPPASIPPDYALSNTQFAPLALTQGQQASQTFSITRLFGFSDSITFSASGLPPGVSASFSPATATGASDSQETVTFTATDDAALGGPVTVTVNGSSPSALGPHPTSFQLTVSSACGDASYGIVHLAALDGGCFHPNGDGTFTYQGSQRLRINGLVAGGVVNFHVDPAHFHITADHFSLSTSDNIPGWPALPIFDGNLDATVGLDASRDGVEFAPLPEALLSPLLSPFSNDASASGDASAQGAPHEADHTDDPTRGSVLAAINLTPDGAELPMMLKLPSTLGGLSAQTTLKWHTATGFDTHVGFTFSLNELDVGPLKIGPLSLSHDGADGWTGSAQIKFPDPVSVGVGGTLGFDHTGLRQIAIHVEGLNLPFVFGSTLDSIDAGYQQFSSGPYTTELNGGIGVTWGPNINGHKLMELDGSLDFKWGDLNTPNGRGGTYWPFDIQAGVTVKVVTIQIGQGTLEVAQDALGPTFRVEAELGIGLPYVRGQDPAAAAASISGRVVIWVQPPNWLGEASVQAHVLGLDIASLDVLISNLGIGGCAHIVFFTGGVGHTWSPDHTDIMGPFGCDISGYRPEFRPQGSRAFVAASGGLRTLRFPAASKPVFLKVIGAGGTPKVTLRGPGGRTLTMPATGTKPITNQRFVVLQDPTTNTTFIAINHPAGKWRLAAEPSSPPVRQVLGAHTVPLPRIRARITGRGSKRTLVYTIADGGGQSIEFAEIGSRTHRLLGRAHPGPGRLRFTPGNGPKGERTIEAVISQHGIPRKLLKVARYRAPAPAKPRDPSAVKVKTASNGTVTVSWKSGTQVADYRVLLKLSNGVVLLDTVKASKRTATFTAIPVTLGVSATVQAQRLNGGLGDVVASVKRH
jgi:hypothetical protein